MYSFSNSTTYQGTQVQKERGGSKLISFLKPFRTIFQRAPRKWLKSNHASGPYPGIPGTQIGDLISI